MGVVPRIDQLCVYPHAIAHPLHAPFDQMRNRQLLTDFAQVALRSSLVLHHRSATDYFQVRNFREISQNLVLHAIGKEGVFFIAAQVFKRQHRDAFFRNVGDGRRNIDNRSSSRHRRRRRCSAAHYRGRTPRQQVSAHSKCGHDCDGNSDNPASICSGLFSCDRYRRCCLLARLEKLLRHFRVTKLVRVKVDHGHA